MKLALTIGNRQLTATLLDNDTANDFLSLLPLTLSMDDLFRREKYAALPRALSIGGPRGFRYSVGDIAYWSPSHDLAIYYEDDGERIPAPGIIPIATLDAGADAFHVPGSVKVTIALLR